VKEYQNILLTAGKYLTMILDNHGGHQFINQVCRISMRLTFPATLDISTILSATIMDTKYQYFNVTAPTEHVLHVEINRPEKLNAWTEP
jgi:hypothetical protein